MEISSKEQPTFFTETDINIIVKNYSAETEAKIEKFKINKASDKMMGFLAEYWKLEVDIKCKSRNRRLNFFIKSIDRKNASKAAMVNAMGLFNKEAAFYKYIKPSIEISDSLPWSAKLAAVFENDLVLEDLSASGYRSRSKMESFDLNHYKRALEAIARFHAGSFVYQNKTKKRGQYDVFEEFQHYLNRGGYTNANPWFNQCMAGALEALKVFSKYGRSNKTFAKIQDQWKNLWYSALDLSNAIDKCANVICHRDLWNNNLLYHYDASGSPDGCVLVDFQAVRVQPPAGDLMLFFYCSNIDSDTLEEVLPNLLRHYHNYLSQILKDSAISIEDFLPFEELSRTAEDQRKWGLVVSCCLLPQIWLDDDKITEIFTDADRFDRILTKDKGSFIKNMMTENSEYRKKVLERFEELVSRYIIN